MSARRIFARPARIAAVAPYLWMLLFFLVPFGFVLKISLSQTAIAQPPYLPLFDLTQDWAAIKASFAMLSMENFRLLISDNLYVLSYLRSLVVATISTAMLLLIGYLVDKSGKLGKYALILMTVAAISAVGANYSTEPYLLVVLLSGVLSASSSGAALVFSVIPKLVDGRGGAAALALVSSVGISAGFFGPFIMGWLKDLTSGYSVAMWIIAVILVFSGVIIFMIDSSVRKRVGPVIVKPSDNAVGATQKA